MNISHRSLLAFGLSGILASIVVLRILSSVREKCRRVRVGQPHAFVQDMAFREAREFVESRGGLERVELSLLINTFATLFFFASDNQACMNWREEKKKSGRRQRTAILTSGMPEGSRSNPHGTLIMERTPSKKFDSFSFSMITIFRFHFRGCIRSCPPGSIDNYDLHRGDQQLRVGAVGCKRNFRLVYM